jgi:hypothetical protein
MALATVNRHTISCYALISACTQGRKWLLALGLLGAMALATVIWHSISYHAVISA